MTEAVHFERSELPPRHSERAQPPCHSERAQRVEESHPLSLGKRRSRGCTPMNGRGCTRIAGQDRRRSIVCCSALPPRVSVLTLLGRVTEIPRCARNDREESVIPSEQSESRNLSQRTLPRGVSAEARGGG